MAMTKKKPLGKKVKRSYSTGGSKSTKSETWQEKRYPRGGSRITSTGKSKDTAGNVTTYKSTFTRGYSGKTTRTDVEKKNGKRTFYQRTNNY